MPKEWKEITEATFDQEFKTGLSRDMYDEIIGLVYRIKFLSGGKSSELKPLRTFNEYINHLKSPEEIERFTRGSKPEAIAAYDALVTEFNSRLNDIKDDIGALREYENKIKELIC